MRCLAMLTFFFLFAVPIAIADDGLALMRDGKSEYIITVPTKPTKPESTAARELQSHLEKVTGAKLEILPEGKVPQRQNQIVVGATRRLAQLVPDVKLDSLGHDGIVVKTVGKDLVLAGQGTRGTLNAVYTFLEDTVGCRWWTSTESFFPKKPTLVIPQLDVVYAPKLRVREAYYRDAFDGVFSARCKCNGHHNKVSEEYGGHNHISGWVHTFYQLLPQSVYFEKHPEWYSEIDGKRKREHAQLCLTNDEMRKELVRNALTKLRREPQASVISISQNDWHCACQCDKCRAVEEEEGSHSGLILRFVNAVAEEIEKEFPDVMVETLAYMYSQKPPKHVKPRHNVIVRLCSIECSFVQPLASGLQNEEFRKDIESWSKIAPRLYVWNYVANFENYILPHPNMRAFAPDIRFFVDHNVIALFEQGDSGTTVGDFVRLRAWLLSHLMWDPNRDDKALIREFLQGYYGPAAPYLEAYLDLIHDAAEQSGVYLRTFMRDTAGYLSLDDVNEATRLFEKAMAAVDGNPVLSRRVRREQISLDHVWLQRYQALKRASKKPGKQFLGPQDPAAARDEYIRLVHEFDNKEYGEGLPFAVEEARLKRRFCDPGTPPKQCEGLSEDDWADFQDNEFHQADPGKWSTTVDDPKASDGKAVRMPGDLDQWAVSLPIPEDLGADGPWRCYVVARSEAAVKDGPAMKMCVYDILTKRNVAYRIINVEESTDEYHAFDLGTINVKGSVSFYLSPPDRSEVTAVYVDRIFMVREEAKPVEKK